jgi:hypothetical protein
MRKGQQPSLNNVLLTDSNMISSTVFEQCIFELREKLEEGQQYWNSVPLIDGNVKKPTECPERDTLVMVFLY